MKKLPKESMAEASGPVLFIIAASIAGGLGLWVVSNWIISFLP